MEFLWMQSVVVYLLWILIDRLAWKFGFFKEVCVECNLFLWREICDGSDKIPSDIVAGKPVPQKWGLPYADFPFGTWCPASKFNKLDLIFDVSFWYVRSEGGIFFDEGGFVQRCMVKRRFCEILLQDSWFELYEICARKSKSICRNVLGDRVRQSVSIILCEINNNISQNF